MIEGELVRGLMRSRMNVVHNVSLRMNPVGWDGNSGSSLWHTVGLKLVLLEMTIVNE